MVKIKVRNQMPKKLLTKVTKKDIPNILLNVLKKSMFFNTFLF
jgi:hypothetical protein